MLKPDAQRDCVLAPLVCPLRFYYTYACPCPYLWHIRVSMLSTYIQSLSTWRPAEASMTSAARTCENTSHEASMLVWRTMRLRECVFVYCHTVQCYRYFTMRGVFSFFLICQRSSRVESYGHKHVR